jgi:predicted nucleic acid-binding protein
VDRVFLDANVLFSAAWGDGGRMRRFWDLTDVELMTSEYAVDEARRNLRDPAGIRTLDSLLRRLTVEDPVQGLIHLPAVAAGLPDDDRPILEAAIAMRASHLLTGNVRDFRPLFGRRVGGVLVLRPSTYWNVVRGP